MLAAANPASRRAAGRPGSRSTEEAHAPRARTRTRTRRQTRYRLSEIQPTPDGRRQALDIDDNGQDGYTVAYPAALGVPAIWAHGTRQHTASWCADASTTTGLPVSYLDQ